MCVAETVRPAYVPEPGANAAIRDLISSYKSAGKGPRAAAARFSARWSGLQVPTIVVWQWGWESVYRKISSTRFMPSGRTSSSLARVQMSLSAGRWISRLTAS